MSAPESNSESIGAPLPGFDDECIRGANLVDDGKLHEAAEVFRTLCQRQDIAEGTRAVMAYNLATVYDKMGHVETAIQTHEYAVTITLKAILFAQENRAKYLFDHSRPGEAIAVWEEILALPFLTDEVIQRTEHNIKTARPFT